MYGKLSKEKWKLVGLEKSFFAASLQNLIILILLIKFKTLPYSFIENITSYIQDPDTLFKDVKRINISCKDLQVKYQIIHVIVVYTDIRIKNRGIDSQYDC